MSEDNIVDINAAKYKGMTLRDFLAKLVNYYPGGMTKERVSGVLNDYEEILYDKIYNHKSKKYDLKKLLRAIVEDYKYKQFPTIAQIIEKLPDARVRNYEQYATNDGTVRVRLKNGRYEDYVPYYTNLTLREIKEYYCKKHTIEDKDGNLICNVESVKYYPPTMTVIGEKIYDDEEGGWIDESRYPAI